MFCQKTGVRSKGFFPKDVTEKNKPFQREGKNNIVLGDLEGKNELKRSFFFLITSKNLKRKSFQKNGV